MKEQVKQWIRNRVASEYKEGGIDLDVALQALDQFLSLKQVFDKQDMEEAIEEMREAVRDDMPMRAARNFSDLEYFLETLMKVWDRQKFDAVKEHPLVIEELPGQKNGKVFNSWKMEALYRLGYHLVGEYTIMQVRRRSVPDGKKKEPSYFENRNAVGGNAELFHKSAYIRAYNFRNAQEHNNLEEDYFLPYQEAYGEDENECLDRMIKAVLVLYLDVCFARRNKIAEAFARQQRLSRFNKHAYLEKLVRDYEREKPLYINFSWHNEDESGDGSDVAALLRGSMRRHVKFLGEAGTGKSTALRRAQYLLAKGEEEDLPDLIPVYMELNSLVNEQDCVVMQAARIMGVDKALALDFIKNGEVMLLLDGFNEILNEELQRRVADEVDTLFRTCEDLRIFMADRAGTGFGIKVLAYAQRLWLNKIDDEQKKEFYASRPMANDLRARLMDKIKSKDPVIQTLNTPLKLEHYVLCAEMNGGKLPENPTRAYIEYLMEREENEKKDRNISIYYDLLRSLAEGMDDDAAIPKKEALGYMSAGAEEIGLKNIDYVKCYVLARNMGILEETAGEDGTAMTRFASNEYKAFFEMLPPANYI